MATYVLQSSLFPFRIRGKTDLVKLAQAMGVNGYRIDNKTTFNEQLLITSIVMVLVLLIY